MGGSHEATTKKSHTQNAVNHKINQKIFWPHSPILPDMQKCPSSASGNFLKIDGNLKILVSKFDFTNLRKYLTPESAGGMILTCCMSACRNWFFTCAHGN